MVKTLMICCMANFAGQQEQVRCFLSDLVWSAFSIRSVGPDCLSARLIAATACIMLLFLLRILLPAHLTTGGCAVCCQAHLRELHQPAAAAGAQQPTAYSNS
jgi:hypothetical protein